MFQQSPVLTARAAHFHQSELQADVRAARIPARVPSIPAMASVPPQQTTRHRIRVVVAGVSVLVISLAPAAISAWLR
jgi:hypothetical protein